LLITIMTLSLIFAVTVQYHKSTWHKFAVSHNYKTAIQIRAIAASGVEIAMAMLEVDNKAGQSDSLQDGWANIDNDAFRGLFPTGTLDLAITDHSGRLQINGLVQKKAGGQSKQGKGGGANNTEQEIRAVLQRLLLSGMPTIEDEIEAKHIVDTLVDWIDEDDMESDYGAENSYYRSLKRPYNCKNGPVENIEELLLVAGITPELLFGADGQKGLADYLTVYGDDVKININTAPLPLIKSLNPLIDDELMEKFDKYRKEKNGKESLGQSAWYKNVGGWPGDIVLDNRLITTKSKYFQIVSSGKTDTMTKHTTAIVERLSDGQFKLHAKKVD
jgi:general secretion pathway protein K